MTRSENSGISDDGNLSAARFVWPCPSVFTGLKPRYCSTTRPAFEELARAVTSFRGPKFASESRSASILDR
jgi:hypothetical protein